MVSIVGEKIEQHIAEAATQYHRLVLVAGPLSTGKTVALRELADKHGWPLINVNRELSERMLLLTPKQRALRVGELISAIRLYAAAREQAATASGANKRIYEDKATEQLRHLTVWLRERITTAVEVTYQGRTKSFAETIKGKLASRSGPAPVRDLLNTAGSVCLAPHFENQAPDYPQFTILLTKENRAQAAQEAVRCIAGGVKSKQATAVLDALELLDGDQLKPRASRYAKQVLDLLGKKPQGQVVNRAELIQDDSGVEYWMRFRIEPEFLAVVLASLVHSGDLVQSVPGRKLDAGSMDDFAKIGIDDLVNFKHVERPRDLPLAPLRELLDAARGDSATSTPLRPSTGHSAASWPRYARSRIHRAFCMDFTLKRRRRR